VLLGDLVASMLLLAAGADRAATGEISLPMGAGGVEIRAARTGVGVRILPGALAEAAKGAMVRAVQHTVAPSRAPGLLWFRASAFRLFAPPLGAVLVALASRSEGFYRCLVREDWLLEWVQVIAYLSVVAVALVGAAHLWPVGERVATFVVIGLGVASLVSVGEELSWGQRLIGFTTPEIAGNNRQGELTLHNDARLEGSIRVGLLVTGLYGVLAPFLVRRRTSLVPPRTLVSFFAVVAAYYAVRLLFLDRPTYVEAKYSEWPETCLAVAVALWCADVVATYRKRKSEPEVD
jgi:hypothetical protein